MQKRTNRIESIIKKFSQPIKLQNSPQNKISLSEIQLVCQESIEIFKEEPTLLRIDAPFIVCGDLFGHFNDMIAYFHTWGFPPKTKYLFLGNYIDNGENSIETIILLLALKIKYPSHIYLLRGDHETPNLNKRFGFFAECAKKYNQSIYETFNQVFNYLPLAAVISQRILCIHGGISPELHSLNQIKNIKRPLSIPEEPSYIRDLICASPSAEHDGFFLDRLNNSCSFGEDVTELFLNSLNLDTLFRSGKAAEEGYEFPFSPGISVLTLFSATDMVGNPGNKGAICNVEENLRCTFSFLDPPKKVLPKTIFSPPSRKNLPV